MPSFVVHMLIPPLLLLATRLAPPRVVLWTLPFTLLPDLDYFIPPHRAVTSNIFVPLLGAAVWQWHRVHRPGRAIHAAVATYYLGSHLLLDLFAGGIVLFWPLWNQNFFFHFEVVIDTLTNQPITEFETGLEEGAPPVARFFTWISAFETAMVALTVATLLVVYLIRRVERRREVYLEEMPRTPTPARGPARAPRKRPRKGTR